MYSIFIAFYIRVSQKRSMICTCHHWETTSQDLPFLQVSCWVVYTTTCNAQLRWHRWSWCDIESYWWEHMFRITTFNKSNNIMSCVQDMNLQLVDGFRLQLNDKRQMCHVSSAIDENLQRHVVIRASLLIVNIWCSNILPNVVWKIRRWNTNSFIDKPTTYM